MLWSMLEPERLSERAQSALASPSNSLLVSIASLWEITIKISAGKLKVVGSDVRPSDGQSGPLRNRRSVDSACAPIRSAAATLSSPRSVRSDPYRAIPGRAGHVCYRGRTHRSISSGYALVTLRSSPPSRGHRPALASTFPSSTLTSIFRPSLKACSDRAGGGHRGSARRTVRDRHAGAAIDHIVS
jgi:hypothetical protein